MSIDVKQAIAQPIDKQDWRPVGLLALSTGMIGIGGALLITTLSLFLSEEVGAMPWMIGLFFAGRAVAEMLCDIVVGIFSDKLASRRLLLAACSALSGCGALLFAWQREYAWLLAGAVVFFGLGGTTFPQLFAYTRELADSRDYSAAFFNSALRAVTSFSWVVGPPLGFALVGRVGYAALYGLIALLYFSAATLFAWAMPDLARSAPPSVGQTDVASWRYLDGATWRLLAVIVLLLTVNTMYQINIALFVIRDLNLGPMAVGLMLGLASALEIPLMIWVGVRAGRFGKSRCMLVCAAAATAFFVLLPGAHSLTALLSLQLLNALYTAILMSIPVVLLQDAMPGRIGLASSLYSSAFKGGAFLGGTLAGVVAQYVGFSHVFSVCSGLAMLSGLLLLTSRTFVRASSEAST